MPNPTIVTFSNIEVDLLNPDPDTINIVDIAHALSGEGRYCNHTFEHYSVAQHSIAIMQSLPLKFKLEGLLHDATEAYLKDLPAPVKHLPQMEFYRQLEKNLDQVIRTKFGLPLIESPEVKECDTLVVPYEKTLYRHGNTPVPEKWKSVLWPPMTRAEARDKFTYFFHRLYDE